MDHRVVIGLEVHVQLLTRTKLFCGCPTQFGLPANSATCPVCLGLPGALPVLNRRAFELAAKAGLALHGEVAWQTKWDRKNYFYPDLPKGYQISQYALPVNRGGWLEITTGDGRRKIGIVRAHLEEDAGKLLHDESGAGGDSFVDLNRAGIPLLEIVSKPDLHSPEEAHAYLDELRLLLRELEISDCEMQEGSLRCDANVNVHIPRPDGSTYATPIVEIKNLNSFRAVERATRYEAARQLEDFRCHGPRPPGKETAGWDERRSVTIVQRRKEEASDYRYFPEPDLPPVHVDPAWLDRLRAELGELPVEQRDRLAHTYPAIGDYEISVLTRQGRRFVRYFENVAQTCNDAKAASNWMINQVLQTLNERNVGIEAFPLSPQMLADLIREVKKVGLNATRAREVYARMVESGQPVSAAIADLGFQVVADKGQLREIVRRALAASPKAVADYRKGKTRALDAIKGLVMRETKGLANIETVQALLAEELSSAGE
jgi:aspartyl-tRNA(Asn)/glutamyl-tRNA(Gln) amidotransferase subunit B